MCEKVFRQQLSTNVAREARDHAESLRASRTINSDVISSKSGLYGASYGRFTETDQYRYWYWHQYCLLVKVWYY